MEKTDKEFDEKDEEGSKIYDEDEARRILGI
jgi:hypothetical protein